MTSFENDEWESVKDVEDEKELARKIAAKSLRKDVRINICLSSSDLANIKQMAA